ncbi:hypothetical protein CAPN008_15220 [Capnocytophaga canis]|uniref:hypothetical protein n=1 Tax=Capnocytophaga canis TaxID=1848903 RepID=UPI001AC91EAE|nr:hypothetical protein [Capnocytophaga canis]GIM61472.1 hypothetical protein CAPN008_15220 [Capnocytophaga canis]
MKYNKTKTINHPLSVKYHCCLKDFNQVVFNEDDSLAALTHFVNDVEVLNLDCAKDKEYFGENTEKPKSMDITFAISDVNKTEMILVDFKLNVKNPNNLTTEELVGKVDDSIELLGSSVPIHSQYIFIFQPNKKQQAENKLYRRMKGRIPNNYKAMDLQDLIKKYF